MGGDLGGSMSDKQTQQKYLVFVMPFEEGRTLGEQPIVYLSVVRGLPNYLFLPNGEDFGTEQKRY